MSNPFLDDFPSRIARRRANTMNANAGANAAAAQNADAPENTRDEIFFDETARDERMRNQTTSLIEKLDGALSVPAESFSSETVPGETFFDETIADETVSAKTQANETETLKARAYNVELLDAEWVRSFSRHEDESAPARFFDEPEPACESETKPTQSFQTKSPQNKTSTEKTSTDKTDSAAIEYSIEQPETSAAKSSDAKIGDAKTGDDASDVLAGALVYAPSLHDFLCQPSLIEGARALSLRSQLEREGIWCLGLDQAAERGIPSRFNRVLLLDEKSLAQGNWNTLRDGATPILLVGEASANHAALPEVFARVPLDGAPLVFHVVRSGLQHGALSRRFAALQQERQLQSTHLHQLNEAGDAFSGERDLDRLLQIILNYSRSITDADVSALYLVEDDGLGVRRLRFKMAQSDSIHFQRDRPLALSHSSIAGYVALNGETVCVDDVYDLPEDAPYLFDRNFDAVNHYCTRSLIAVPLRRPDGAIFGVLQLINRRGKENEIASGKTETLAFSNDEVELAVSLAGQVAVAMENSHLHGSVEELFEGFVTATARTIEQRDPATSGHSERVAILSTGLARAVSESRDAPFSEVYFTPSQMKELHYATILHDFGKVIVHEDVLLKCNKLHSHELELLKLRFEMVHTLRERDLLKRKYEMLLTSQSNHDIDDAFERFTEWDEALTRESRDLDEALTAVTRANNPLSQWLDDSEFKIHRGLLSRLCHVFYWDRKRRALPLLSDHELRCLTVRHGSLSETERREVERHVVHTFEFLKQIPWTHEYSMVPQIARCHHERIDGNGYPQGLRGDAIPLQSRIMTVCDIYDALTASDRPYKRSCTLEEALEILRKEAKDGHIEPALVELFIKQEIWKLTSGWRKRQRNNDE